MKRAPGLRLLGLGLVLVFLLVGVASVIHHMSTSTQGSAKSTIVSSSGQNLAALFDGLPRNPKYSLKTISDMRRKLPRCGQKQEVGIFQRIYQRLFGSSVVFAKPTQPNLLFICIYTDCGGTGWAQFTDYCDTGKPCSGMCESVDYVGGTNMGFYSLGLHCGGNDACGCIENTCPDLDE
jgi:hypothetical protein